jgi:hypothetical protein
LLKFIEQDIYSNFYHRPSPYSPLKSFPVVDDFITALSKANYGAGTWEPGWTIIAVEDDGRIVVSKNQVNYWVEPVDLLTTTENIHPGNLCRVRIAKEMRYLYPGFYMAIGNGYAPDTSGPLVRLYWNLTPKGAVHYMKLITERLNEKQIPFRTKVVSEPGLYHRADAGVLYVEKVFFLQIQALIRDIYQEIRTGLKSEVPMFTKPIGEGLGLAEDPGNGLSFGLSRCRIVARGLWLGYTKGQTDPELRLSALISVFQSEGLNPERPYLEKDSDDIYNELGDEFDELK